MMIIGLLAIGVLVYYLMGENGDKGFSTLKRSRPEDILKERFANGEIDEVQYLQMKQAIK